MSDSTEPLRRVHPRPAGTVAPWPEQRREMGEMTGDEQLVKRTWEEMDSWTYAFLWHCVVSF
jgi:hypothetical protein